MAKEVELVPVERFAELLEWLPTSPHHVKAYLNHKRYPIPKQRKTKKPTTNEEALAGLLYKYPNDVVLAQTLHARHLTKAVGYLYDTFLGADGRLHPIYTFLPKTGRLSSKAPNLMNLPQGRKGGDIMKEVANAIRSAIVPDPNYLIAEFDWKGIEALLVGYFADDPDYMRICRIDIHSYTASYGAGEPADPAWDDARLSAYLLGIKKKYNDTLRQEFKKAGHADNYGQGVWNMAKDMGCTVEKAQWYKDIIAKAAPKVAKWKHETRLRAHAEGQLSNPFGYSLAFFEVFRPEKADDGTIKWYLGKEAQECLAFLPQSTAASMLRDCLVQLGTHPDEGSKFQLLIPTHDSITLQIKKEHFDEIMLLVKTVMEQKWPQLGGLWVETEAKFGPSLKAKDLQAWAA